ncbi:hypothetical protein HG531_002401 [Fusarium graminearum]|nr:hypothetical protein HG531_002401 [Fusarium graminearum]
MLKLSIKPATARFNRLKLAPFITCKESLKVLLLDLALDKIHLGQDVDVWHLEHKHGTHGTESSREEFCAINDKCGFEKINSGHANIERSRLRQELDQSRQDGNMGVQLDLSRHINNDEILFGQTLESVRQPVKVLHEELEAIDETAIRPEANFFHGIFERDELLDVEVGLMFERLGSGIEVDVKGGTAVKVKMGNEGGAKSRLDVTRIRGQLRRSNKRWGYYDPSTRFEAT